MGTNSTDAASNRAKGQEANRNLASISPFFIVKDLHVSISYYIERLGFRLDFQGPGDDPYYTGVGRDGIGIMLKCGHNHDYICRSDGCFVERGVLAMERRPSFALFVLWLAAGTAAMAQAPDRAQPVFTRQAITAALLHVTATIAAPQGSRDDWSHLRQLKKSDIVLFAQGIAGRRCRIVDVDDTALTVLDLESPNRTTLRIPRLEVSEIRKWTGRRGSLLGAVIGAAGGLVLGFGSAIALADKQCGGSCTDERVLIGASLVGMPIAGGLLGYRLPGGNRTLTTIYLKP